MKIPEQINITIKEGVEYSYDEFKSIHEKHFKIFQPKQRESKLREKYLELFPNGTVTQKANTQTKKSKNKKDKDDELSESSKQPAEDRPDEDSGSDNS